MTRNPAPAAGFFHRMRRLPTFLALPLAAGCFGADSISLSEERAIGSDLARQAQAELPMLRDPVTQAFVGQLGAALAARAGDQERQYEFHVVNSPHVNAFAIPGGFIFINRGILEQSANASELAGVIAHEIGHVVQRHSAEAIARERSANTLLGLVYLLLQRTPSEGERIAVQVAGSAWMARHSREDELEADRVALRLLTRSGVDPRGLPEFFETLLAQEQQQPALVLQWFGTHPLTEDRVRAAERMIATLPDEAIARFADDLPGFDAMQARLRQLPPPPQPPDPQGLPAPR